MGQGLGVVLHIKGLYIQTLGKHYFVGSLAIRIFERGETSFCSRRLSFLLSWRKIVPTHFYEEWKTQQKDSRFVGRTTFIFFIPDLCSTSKDQIFLCERCYRPILKGLQHENTKPFDYNLIIFMFGCLGFQYTNLGLAIDHKGGSFMFASGSWIGSVKSKNSRK